MYDDPAGTGQALLGSASHPKAHKSVRLDLESSAEAGKPTPITHTLTAFISRRHVISPADTGSGPVGAHDDDRSRKVAGSQDVFLWGVEHVVNVFLTNPGDGCANYTATESGKAGIVVSALRHMNTLCTPCQSHFAPIRCSRPGTC